MRSIRLCTQVAVAAFTAAALLGCSGSGSPSPVNASSGDESLKGERAHTDDDGGVARDDDRDRGDDNDGRGEDRADHDDAGDLDEHHGGRDAAAGDDLHEHHGNRDAGKDDDERAEADAAEHHRGKGPGGPDDGADAGRKNDHGEEPAR